MSILCILITLLVLHVSSARERSLHTNVGRIAGQIQNISLLNPAQTSSEVASFLGIPYAESPTGNRRFLKPVRKAKFTETFNALKYGASCPQSSPGFQYERIDEDCLNLNIHTPEVTDAGRNFSVMIWIHGGGFILGNGRVFGGKELAVYGQVVVVTINYRLGVFGFLNTEDTDVDANAGLYDQHLAIQWVHDNIADFGGDPTRVTIFGESAGAVSVIHQALFQDNEGLFQRVIAQSGTANLPSAITLHPLDRAITFAKEIKCPVTSNKEMVKCLRARNMAELLKGTGLWTPSYDGIFVAKDRVEALNIPANSSSITPFKNVDLLMGTNGYEGQLFIGGPPFTELYGTLKNDTTSLNELRNTVNTIFELKLKGTFKDKFSKDILEAVSFQYSNYQDPNDKSRHIQNICDLLTDIEFYIPSFTTIRTHAYNNSVSKTFQYEFNEHYPFLKRDFWIDGALHADELPYTFGFPEEMKSYYGNYNRSQALSQWSLSSTIMYYWSNFAKTGNPNDAGADPTQTVIDVPLWSEFSTDGRNYMYLTSTQLENRTELNARRVRFWREYIPRILQKNEKRKSDRSVCVASHASSLISPFYYNVFCIISVFCSVIRTIF